MRVRVREGTRLKIQVTSHRSCSGLNRGAGLGLLSPSPMGTWALWGETLRDQSRHPDVRRGSSCWTTAASSTGSALQRMALVTLPLNDEGEVIPAPKDLRAKRDKGCNRGLRKGFKDLLVSITLFRSTWLLLVGSSPGVCNKAFKGGKCRKLIHLQIFPDKVHMPEEQRAGLLLRQMLVSLKSQQGSSCLM